MENLNCGSVPVYYSYVGSSGLTHSMENKLYSSSSQIKQEIARHPKSNGVIGSITPDWAKKIPLEKRSDSVKKIYDSFAQASSLLKQGNLEQNTKKAEEIIRTALQNSGIVTTPESVNLKCIGKGQYGIGYKLGVNGNDFVMKVFRDPQAVMQQQCKGFFGFLKKMIIKYHYNTAHGALLEANRSAFWSKNKPNSKYDLKFMFADLKNNFMVDKYVDNFTPSPKKAVNPADYGVYHLDIDFERGHNCKNGYAIDLGGQRVSNKVLATNKTARKTYRRVLKTNSENRCFKIIELYSKKEPNKENVKIGLYEALKKVPAKDRRKIPQYIIKDIARAKNKNFAAAICNYADEISSRFIKFVEEFHLSTKNNILRSGNLKKFLLKSLRI